jgi:hypothetical protein
MRSKHSVAPANSDMRYARFGAEAEAAYLRRLRLQFQLHQMVMMTLVLWFLVSHLGQTRQ